MAMVLTCREAGYDCDYIARGDTQEAVLMDAAAHAKQVHNMTGEQINDPQTKEKLTAMIREE